MADEAKPIDEAIKKVLSMIRTNGKPDESLKLSQAALNLAQTKQILDAAGSKTKGAGS